MFLYYGASVDYTGEKRDQYIASGSHGFGLLVQTPASQYAAVEL